MERKIVIVSNSNLNRTGGSEESMKNILNYDRNNSSITYVSPHKLPDTYSVNKEYVTLTGVHKVAREIAQDKPDVIILNNPEILCASFLLSLPQELRDKTCAIWRIVSTSWKTIPVRSSDNKFINYINRTLIEKSQGFLANRVGQNLAVSSAVKESLQNSGTPENKIQVINEQVGGEFNPSLRLNNHDNNRQRFLQPDEFGVLFVGRLSPEKGLDLLVKTYHQLRQEIPHFSSDKFSKIKISIIGPVDSSYAQFIKRQFNLATFQTRKTPKSDRVQIELLGQQSHTQLQPLYNAYDLLFMPSPSEGFGRVTVEALSAGLPVIGRDGCKATEEILSRPLYSIGTTISGSTEAVREIFYLMNQTETLSKLKQQSSQWASNFYTQKNSESSFWQAVDQVSQS